MAQNNQYTNLEVVDLLLKKEADMTLGAGQRNIASLFGRKVHFLGFRFSERQTPCNQLVTIHCCNNGFLSI